MCKEDSTGFRVSVKLVICNFKLGPFVFFVFILVYYCLYQTQFADDSDHACVWSHFLQGLLESIKWNNKLWMKMWEGRIDHFVYICVLKTQNVASGILDYYKHP